MEYDYPHNQSFSESEERWGSVTGVASPSEARFSSTFSSTYERTGPANRCTTVSTPTRTSCSAMYDRPDSLLLTGPWHIGQPRVWWWKPPVQ